MVEISKPGKWNDNVNVEPCILWSRLREGDKEAVSKLFCMYYTQLYHYGYKMVPQAELIKDCIQELFLSIWNARDGISDPYSVKAYLLSSFRRIILRKVKKDRNREKRNQMYHDNFIWESANIEELLIRFETEKELNEELVNAIESLSKRQAEAIFLKYYQGLTNDEIARVMGINKQSVYNYVSEAISDMQTYIRSTGMAA